MKIPRLQQRILLKAFCRDNSGATLVEYGVALLVVILVGAGAIGALGTSVGETISATADAF